MTSEETSRAGRDYRGPEAAILVQYVVYRRPEDFDAEYVVRRWFVGGGLAPDLEAHPFDSLDAARAWIEDLGLGLVRLAPSYGDDPVICEVWT